jgi:hypothetical protein
MEKHNEIIWVGDTASKHEVGDYGFLVELQKPADRYTWWELRGHPARTPTVGLPQLYGCVKDGQYTRVFAHGVGKVVETKKNGRARVEAVASRDEVVTALDQLGFPELIPQQTRDP